MRVTGFNSWIAGALFIALVATLIVSDRAQARELSPLRIADVAVVDSRITITGSSFGSTPSVTIAGTPLGVANSSDTEIVAQMVALPAGLYELTVSRGGAAPEDTASTVVVIR
jgi:hypothetical protein